ncbi:MAG TPA: ribonuclease HI family protein [Urbifossiella sp.]|jgi:ribonuclease HI|nr:ribonuclease HI family protein [Urbifossiella sp.]
MDSPTATMHIDGAARGNPGPAAYAVVLARPGLPAVEEAGTLGTATNNVAEYTALVNGLHLATELGLKRLDVFSDSELMVKQMAGEYRVKHPDLQPLHQEATELRKGFEAVRITHVRREQNKRADALCNEALDGKRAGGGAPAPASTPAAKPKPPAAAVTDERVRADALAVLGSAARAWADRGLAAAPVEAVWEQLWSVLEEAGVLKKR